MQILKRFLLCTVLVTGICISPVTKAFAGSATEQTANETGKQDTTLYSSNQIEQTDIPDNEVPKGSGVEIREETSKAEITESASANEGAKENLIVPGKQSESSQPSTITTADTQTTNKTTAASSKTTNVTSTSSNQTNASTTKITTNTSTKTSVKTTSNTVKTTNTAKTTKTASNSSSKESTKATEKETVSKVPKMYINVSEYRTNLLMKMVELAPKDKSYTGKKVKITGKNRELLEALVYGEAGGEGFIGQCLVAQTIRDTMIEENEMSVKKIISLYQYSGKTNKGTSQEVKDAVRFIFDEGGYVVQHRIVFFYAPKICRSRFHEKQKFIIEYKGHRFFDNSVWIARDKKKK